MPSILTQEEVDALLTAVASGELAPVLGGDMTPRRVDAFTFGQSSGGGASMKELDHVHDQFADSAGESLSSLLSMPIVIARTAVNRVKGAEYAPTVSQPSMIYRVRLESDGPEVLVQLGSGTVLAMIERLFGGPVVSPIHERPLTLIETSVLKRVVQKLNSDLARSWARYRALEPEIIDAESQPELVQLEAAGTLVLVTFEVRLAESVGLLSLAYPEEFLNRAFGDGTTADAGDTPVAAAAVDEEAMARRLGMARVPMAVQLGTARLTLREVADLSVGDVIRLNTPVDGTMVARVNGLPKFMVRPGKRGDVLAVSVTGTCSQENDS